MKSFRGYINPKELVAFCHAGGSIGQYDTFSYKLPFFYGRGGGSPESEDVTENLNPRNRPEFIHSDSRIMFDPDQDNKGLGEDRYHPSNIGIPNRYDTGHVNPSYNREQSKIAKRLANDTDINNYQKELYYHATKHYSKNSYYLNGTLFHHHHHNTNPSGSIRTDPDDSNSEIDIKDFDDLIQHHQLSHAVTVYSGIHFHPNEHQGKISIQPSYMSTSIAPHVAKDFGKDYEFYDEHGMTRKVKNILRLHLPKGHPALFADNGSLFPGQGELILPRGMRYQLGQRPTHIIQGKFDNHFGSASSPNDYLYHIYTGRILS